MPRLLLVTDAPRVRNEVHAALTDAEFELLDHEAPDTAADVALRKEVDLVIADLQIGSMGGMAVTRAIRQATGDGTNPGLPVVLLLDRGADGFLAKRAGAAAWLTKPFTSYELEAAVKSAFASRSVGAPAEDGAG